MNIFEAIKRRIQKKYPIDAEGADEEVGISMVEFDGVEYMELMKLPLNGNTYVFLSNPEDASDFFVKKLIVEDGEQYLIGIDNREEFDNTLLHFTKQALGT